MNEHYNATAFSLFINSEFSNSHTYKHWGIRNSVFFFFDFLKLCKLCSNLAKIENY
jgi:hypothetical protein